MCQPKIAIPAAFLVGILPLMTSSAGKCQDAPAKSNKTEGKKADDKKTDEKKTDQKKAAAKTIDFTVKVSAKEGVLPQNITVEISGQENACGDLNSEDATAAVNKNGEAVFKGLPICKVRIKVNAQLYLPAIKTADLSKEKSPISITLEREK